MQEKKEIANDLGITIKGVEYHLRKARKEGIIKEVEPKEKANIEQVLKLYNKGKTRDEIAKKLGITKEDVAYYIKNARKKGLIEKPRYRLKQIAELYNRGKTRDEIAEELEIKEHTVNQYLNEAGKLGLIKRKKHERYNKCEKENNRQNDEANEEKVAKMSGYVEKAEKAVSRESNKVQEVSAYLKDNPSEKISQIIELCVKHYPRDVGKMLGLKPVKVYDAIDSLDDLQSKKLLKRRLMNNPLYNKVKGLMKSKGMKANQALYEMVKTEKGYLNRINLAKMYYLLGNDKIPQRLLNEILSDEIVSYKVRQMAEEEKEKIMLEITSSKIREEYKNGRNMDGSKISYDDLCKRHNVRVGFILDVLGQEEMNIER